MANGRMIVKSISYDTRVWDQMSDAARMYFAFIIPHQESDGTVPRSPRELRLMCFPCAKIRDSDVESFIHEWLKTTPPICTENGDKLKFTDFDKSNQGLSLFRVRRHRANRQK